MNNPKLNWKKVSVGLIIITVMMGSYIGYVWSTSPLSTIYISNGTYPGAPSYTVWTDGIGNYYAKNEYGQNEYFGTDAKEVIRSTLSTGTHILLKEGTYEIPFESNMLEIGTGQILEGVGDATILKLTGKPGGSGVAINGLYARPITLVGQGATIKHLFIDGNSAGLTWRSDYTSVSSFSAIVTGITNLDTYVAAYYAKIEDITLHDITPNAASKALGLYGIGITLFYSPYAVVNNIRIQTCDNGIFAGTGMSTWTSEYSISNIRAWDGVYDKIAVCIEEGTVNIFDVRCVNYRIYMPAGVSGVRNSTFNSISIELGSWNGGGSGSITRCTFNNVIITDYYPPDTWGLNLDQLVGCMFTNIIIYPDPVGGIHLVGTYNATNCNWLS